MKKLKKITIPFFAIIALFISTNVKAFGFTIWAIITVAVVLTGDTFNTSSSNANNVLSSVADVTSVSGDIFVKFYKTLDGWFRYFYQVLGNELSGLFWGIATVMALLTFLLFLKGKAEWEKLGKLFLYVFIAAIFLKSSNEFYYWFVEPLLGLQQGLIYLSLGVDDKLLTQLSGLDKYKQASFAIFSGVEHIFLNIFTQIGVLWDDISLSGWIFDTDSNTLDGIANIFAIFLLLFTYGFLYLVFSILIFVGYFGLYIWLAVLPVVLLMAIVTRQILFSWLKQVMTYLLMPFFTGIVMSATLPFLNDALKNIEGLSDVNNLWTVALGYAIFVGILSIGMHWKAAEFAAALAGGMQNAGATSVAGAFGITAGSAYAATRGVAGGASNAVSGWGGGNYGNKNSTSYQASQDLRDKLFKGGEDFPKP